LFQTISMGNVEVVRRAKNAGANTKPESTSERILNFERLTINQHHFWIFAMLTMNQLQLAAKLEESRRAAMRLLGERYYALGAPYREILLSIVSQRKCTIWDALTETLKACEFEPEKKMMLAAAAVDLIENDEV
jgi:hypothetical protein